MLAPPIANEGERLAALREFNVLDTPPEAEYDDLTRLAAMFCGTPIALVSLTDDTRQWFKSRHGVGAVEIPRAGSLCSHAVAGDDLFVVPDAAADGRFKDNLIVVGEPHVRFYAGVPLTTPEGHNLGTLCVIDRVPRTLTTDQQVALRVLGRQVVAQLVLRRQVEVLTGVEADLRAERERFRAFMDNSPAAAFLKDEDGRMLYFNDLIRRRFEIKDDADWIGKTDAELWPDDVARTLRQNDVAVLAGGTTLKVLEAVPTPDGTSRHWQVFKFPFTDPGGRRFLAGMAVDVTAEKKAADTLAASEQKFRTIVDRLDEGLYVVDPGTGRFVEVNAAVLTLLGYTATEFLALSLPDIVAHEPPEVVARNVKYIEVTLARDGRCDLGRKHLRRKDGSVVPVGVRVTLVPDGGAGLHAVIVRDLSEQVQTENLLFEYQSDLEDANARLKALATTDGLTGAKNRAAFNDALAEQYRRATRHGHPLSVVLMDVDHFKLFNDTFGHPAGDEVLKTVARTLRDTARTTDFVARYGGEEFVVILPDTDFGGAMVLAERFRRAVAAVPWDMRAVTVSVGVATLTATTTDAAGLLREADNALYESKRAGRNRVNHGSGAVPMLATHRT